MTASTTSAGSKARSCSASASRWASLSNFWTPLSRRVEPPDLVPGLPILGVEPRSAPQILVGSAEVAQLPPPRSRF